MSLDLDTDFGKKIEKQVTKLQQMETKYKDLVFQLNEKNILIEQSVLEKEALDDSIKKLKEKISNEYSVLKGVIEIGDDYTGDIM